ncbi:hypothetical protein [uncultured Mediterranean phage]|nr:hypothetical protein [uncultured Mediterranean phage]
MTSMNAILLLDYLSVRRQQQETHLQILRNEAISAERSYNLLFSYISHNQRTTTRNSVDEMTGILSSISNLSTPMRGETRRSTPSLATPSIASQLRSTMNRSTSTTPATQRWSWSTPHRAATNRNRTANHLAREWTFPQRIFPQTITRTTFDETPLPPTQAEIEIATVTCKYQDVSTNQLMCPIARTNFESGDDILQIIHCNHIFKKESLLTWFETKQTCPICRHNITSTPSNTPGASSPIGPRLPSV